MDTYKLFLQDLVVLLRQKYEQAKEQQNSGGDFEKGVSMGFYEVIDLIKSQALAFTIPLEEINLSGYLPENYL